MSTKRVVALCDILGFSKLVAATPLVTLVDIHLAYFRRMLWFCANHQWTTSDSPSLADLRDQTRVGLAWFSDTVLIYGLDDSDLACENVVETVGWLLFTTTTATPHLSMRAGVAYDDFFADPADEIFVGNAVVDAHRLEQAQDWIGGALSAQAAQRAWATDMHPLVGWTYPYEIPWKPKERPQIADLVSEHAINWTCGHHEPASPAMQWLAQQRPPDANATQEEASIQTKWNNTRRFHDAVCAFCRRR